MTSTSEFDVECEWCLGKKPVTAARCSHCLGYSHKLGGWRIGVGCLTLCVGVQSLVVAVMLISFMIHLPDSTSETELNDSLRVVMAGVLGTMGLLGTIAGLQLVASNRSPPRYDLAIGLGCAVCLLFAPLLIRDLRVAKTVPLWFGPVLAITSLIGRMRYQEALRALSAARVRRGSEDTATTGADRLDGA